MVYRIAHIRIDPEARLFEREGVVQDVPKRVFDCLVFLIEHRARAVSRDELIARVWHRSNVSDNQLAQTVLAVRKLLDDDGTTQRLVRTVPGFGYHFIGAVEMVEAIDAGDSGLEHRDDALSKGPDVSAEPMMLHGAGMPVPDTAASMHETDAPVGPINESAPRVRLHLLPMAWALAGLVALVALVASWWAGPAETPQPERLQGSTQADWVWVLPADVAASDIDWARIGIATLIADRLRHHGMVVVPIDNVVARLGDASPPSEPEALRREWGAARVVVPTVRREGGQWRVELMNYTLDGVERVSATVDDLVLAGQQAADALAVGRPLALESDAPGARIAIIDQLIRSRDYENAASQLALLPEDERRHPDARLLEVRFAMEQGRFEEASRRAAALRSELRADAFPDVSGRLALFEIDFIRFRRGNGWEDRVDPVIAQLEAHGRPSDLAGALGLRGFRALRREDFDAAQADFARAQQLYLSVADELGAARANDALAKLLSHQGRHAEAVRLLDECAAVYERYSAVGDLVSVLRVMVSIQHTLRRWGDAEAASDRARALAPMMNEGERATYLEGRGTLMLAMGRMREASALFDESDAIREGSETSRASRLKARLLRLQMKAAQGRFVEVSQGAAEAYAEFASEPEGFFNSTFRDWALMLWFEARRQIRAADPASSLPAIDVEPAALSAPDSAFAWLARGHRDRERGALDEAEVSYRRALRMALDRNTLSTLVTAAEALSSVLVDEGRVDEATQVMEEVLARDPYLPDRDFDTAVMLMRVRQAQADLVGWRRAEASAKRLAGERPIPADLLKPPPG